MSCCCASEDVNVLMRFWPKTGDRKSFYLGVNGIRQDCVSRLIA